MYRWLLLSLTAYLLAHWAYLHSGGGALPDWGKAAQIALHLLLPSQALLALLVEIQPLQPRRKNLWAGSEGRPLLDLSMSRW